MLIAFQHKNGHVQVFDTDEMPAAYLFSIEERTLVAGEHERAAKTRGGNNILHFSMNDLTRRDVAGPGREVAMRALADHIVKHPKASRYMHQHYALEGATAQAVEPGKVVP